MANGMEKPKITVQVLLSEDDKKMLKSFADGNGMSLSQAARFIIIDYFRRKVVRDNG